MWISRLLFLTAIGLSTCKEVCYPEVGCFSNDSPWDNAKGTLPESPEGQHVKVLLHTRQQRHSGTEVQYNEPDLMSVLDGAHFDTHKDTKFVSHGFGGSPDIDWMRDIKNALLEKEDVNVLVVDWRKAAKMPDYFQAVANIRVAGAELQILLEAMQEGGVDLAKVHLIGHSLGAQLFAELGRRMNGTIGRITAIDAAAPLFENRWPDVRLDRTDAMFVDVIHTDGDDLGLTSGAGIGQASGHVDFYPNGGKNQPGCFDHTLGHITSFFGRKRAISDNFWNFVGCSHQRSVALFIESILSDCAFTAYPCSDYDSYNEGDCPRDCSNNRCNEMGYHADPSRGKGILYIKTNKDKPYCDPRQSPKKAWWWPFGR